MTISELIEQLNERARNSNQGHQTPVMLVVADGDPVVSAGYCDLERPPIPDHDFVMIGE